MAIAKTKIYDPLWASRTAREFLDSLSRVTESIGKKVGLNINTLSEMLSKDQKSWNQSKRVLQRLDALVMSGVLQPPIDLEFHSTPVEVLAKLFAERAWYHDIEALTDLWKKRKLKAQSLMTVQSD